MTAPARPTRRALLRAGAGGMLAAALGGLSGCSSATRTVAVSPGCLVEVDGVHDLRDADQSANAAIITGEAIRRGLPPRAASIALVTAIQESKLYNLSYGDLDSVGLFQQRPSQGWGTQEQIMDPWYSSGKFYEALVKVDNWQNADINDVAQQVQHSGVPDGYAGHEPIGRAWASALTGQNEAAVTNVDQAGAAGDPEALRDFVVRVWPQSVAIALGDDSLTLTASDSTTIWSVAQLLMCRGSAAGLVGLRVGAMTWTNDTTARAGWTGSNSQPPTQVVATVRGS